MLQIKLFPALALCGFLFFPLAGAANAEQASSAVSGNNGAVSAASFSEKHPENFAGEFLASHFAQSQYDWQVANRYLEQVLKQDPDNRELLERAMVLAAGSGDMKIAAAHAQKLMDMNENHGLVATILSLDALSQGKLGNAEKYLDAVPANDIVGFIKPIVAAWVKAGLDKTTPAGLEDSSIHLYHGALISLFLDDKEKAKFYTQKMMELEGLGTYEGERLADLLAALGEYDAALGLYKGLQIQSGKSTALDKKIQALQSKSGDIEALLKPLKIKSPATGVAFAINDLARILYQEQSDSSTQLFSRLALSLNPNLVEAKILLADTLARNKRYEEAIALYMSIPETEDSYLGARHEVAELMAEMGRDDDARILLNDLFNSKHDVDALIRIGDLYRAREDYTNSLAAYNRAVAYIGDDLGEEYWHLLYARGMSYEREGKWDKAEADLQRALSFQPNHPYILNYLGYSWADRGENLERSLDLIKKAVSLQPTDGYIVDSLGWVYYMMGRYEEALPHLEKAASLLSYDPVINDHLGDVYWQTGRRLEAVFQWERARNYSEDPELIKALEEKMKNGIEAPVVKQAKSGLE